MEQHRRPTAQHIASLFLRSLLFLHCDSLCQERLSTQMDIAKTMDQRQGFPGNLLFDKASHFNV